ncbi:hypothetical protein G5I_01301 [Acromyrmex echinatior]|uniref:Uncharacterized protein n=1 Tax=Acromyrmex echinatior TaxID=103372 RepID=F4W792_ACREC|nr:hypothetical protein G5I_01301 [Acromyrmex echinatior]
MMQRVPSTGYCDNIIEDHSYTMFSMYPPTTNVDWLMKDENCMINAQRPDRSRLSLARAIRTGHKTRGVILLPVKEVKEGERKAMISYISRSNSHYIRNYVGIPRRREAVEECNQSEMPSCLRHWLGIHGPLYPQKRYKPQFPKCLNECPFSGFAYKMIRRVTTNCESYRATGANQLPDIIRVRRPDRGVMVRERVFPRVCKADQQIAVAFGRCLNATRESPMKSSLVSSISLLVSVGGGARHAARTDEAEDPLVPRRHPLPITLHGRGLSDDFGLRPPARQVLSRKSRRWPRTAEAARPRARDHVATAR